MAIEEATNVTAYIIGLGRVGTKLVKQMYDLNLRPPTSMYKALGLEASLELLPPQKLLPETETQIIDMAVETDLIEQLRRNYDFGEDEIRIIRFDRQKYDALYISRKAHDTGYNVINVFWKMTESVIRDLGPGKGVQRYRPLARLFASIAAPDIISVMSEDYREDFGGRCPAAIYAILSAGGGFGSGAFTTITSLAKAFVTAGDVLPRVKAFINIPVGGRYNPALADPSMRWTETDLKASTGMAILDLLYLREYYLVNSRPYRDELVNYIIGSSRMTDRPELGLYPIDEIIISALANLEKHRYISNASEQFEAHDDLFSAAILASLAGYRQVESGQQFIRIVDDNNPINYYINQVLSAFTEQREILGLADVPATIFAPVSIYSIGFIRVDKKKISRATRTLDAAKNELEKLKENIKKTDEKIAETEKSLQKTRQELSKLQELKKTFDDAKVKIAGISVRRGNLLTQLAQDNLRKEIEAFMAQINRSIEEDLNRPIMDFTNNINRAITSLHQLRQTLLTWSQMVAVDRSFMERIKGEIRNISDQIVMISESLSNARNAVNRIIELVKGIVNYKSEHSAETRSLEERLGETLALNLMSHLIPQVTSLISSVENEVAALESALEDLLRSILRYRGRVFCGRPCKLADLLKRTLREPQAIESNIITLRQMREELEGFSTNLSNYVKEYDNMLRDEISSKEKDVAKIKQTLEGLEEERERLLKEVERLLEEIRNSIVGFYMNYIKALKDAGVEFGGVLRIIDVLDSHMRELYEKVDRECGDNKLCKAEKLLEHYDTVISGVAGPTSIVGMLKVVGRLQRGLEESLRDSLVSRLIERSNYATVNIDSTWSSAIRDAFFSGKESEAHAILEGMGLVGGEAAVHTDYVVIYTRDNEELARALREELRIRANVNHVALVEVESEKSSFLGVLKRVLNVPIIAVREVREVLKAALEDEPLTAEEMNALSSILGERAYTARMPRGLKFTTISIDRDFIKFLKGFKEALERYERALSTPSRG